MDDVDGDLKAYWDYIARMPLKTLSKYTKPTIDEITKLEQDALTLN